MIDKCDYISFQGKDTLKLKLYESGEYLVEKNEKYLKISFNKRLVTNTNVSDKFSIYNVYYEVKENHLSGYLGEGYMRGYWKTTSKKGKEYLILKNIIQSDPIFFRADSLKQNNLSINADSLKPYDRRLEYVIEDKTDSSFTLVRVKK